MLAEWNACKSVDLFFIWHVDDGDDDGCSWYVFFSSFDRFLLHTKSATNSKLPCVNKKNSFDLYWHKSKIARTKSTKNVTEEWNETGENQRRKKNTTHNSSSTNINNKYANRVLHATFIFQYRRFFYIVASFCVYNSIAIHIHSKWEKFIVDDFINTTHIYLRRDFCCCSMFGPSSISN